MNCTDSSLPLTTTSQTSDELSVWSAFQTLLLLLDDETNNYDKVLAILLELQNEPSISAEITVAVQYWQGIKVAGENPNCVERLTLLRCNQFDKYFEEAQAKVFANPVFYGGPEAAKDDDSEGIQEDCSARG